jgi:hypothetical protein
MLMVNIVGFAGFIVRMIGHMMAMIAIVKYAIYLMNL